MKNRRVEIDEDTRRRMQEQERREMEIALLDSVTDMREFIDMRKNLPKFVLHPELPRDQMTAADYIRMRRGDRDVLGRRIK